MSYVVLREKGIRALFANPNGPVAKIIKGKADRIEANARAQIAAKYEERTGDLIGSMKQVPILDPRGYRIAVGADAKHRNFNYARALELGQTDGGVELKISPAKVGYMKPAVLQSGFRRRSV